MGTTELICFIMQEKKGYFYCSEIKELCDIKSIHSIRSSITVIANAGLVKTRKGVRSKSGERIAYKFNSNAHEGYQTLINRDIQELVQAKIVRFIEQRGQCKLSDLSNDLVHSKSAISKNLKLLCQKGKIVREKVDGIVLYELANQKVAINNMKAIIDSALNSGMRNCA